MLRVLFPVLSLLFVSPAIANVLHVKAGESISIGVDQSRLQLTELILEDGATINVLPEVKRWQVSAAKVIVGNDVRIVGVGAQGADGGIGDGYTSPAARCEDGRAGDAGKQGSHGGTGVAIAMDLNIVRWGSLIIANPGGVGGQGGAGGNGQQAGEVDKCNQTRGGAGGFGGDGGDGGNGGNVRIRYSYTADSEMDTPLDKFLVVENQGGIGGVAGAGGEGGEASKGRYISMRTLTGTKKWVPGGKAGPQGTLGKSGRRGVNGMLLIEEDLSALVDKHVQQLATYKFKPQANQVGDQTSLQATIEAQQATINQLQVAVKELQALVAKQAEDIQSKSTLTKDDVRQLIKELLSNQ